MAWLTGYNYRKSVTLSRASGAVSNYQMKLLLGESSGATGEDVDCGGLCLSNFNDIRFTTSDGTTLLDYWIESISGVTPNQLATIWIEFDSIGTDATTFYMYYGNTGASAASSGANTFIAFDNFERGSNGDAVGGVWTAVGATISTDHAHEGTRSCKIGGHANDWTNSISMAVTAGNIAIKYRFWKETAAKFAVWHGNGSYCAAVTYRTTEAIYASNAESSDIVDTTKSCLADQWDVGEIKNFNFTAHSYDIYYTGSALAASGSVMITGASSNNKVLITDRGSGDGNDTYLEP